MLDEAGFREFYEWASLLVMKLGLDMSTHEFTVNIIIPEPEAIKQKLDE
jgi:hypothetical protein